MQYLILAYDGTDPGALDRRLAVRPRHLEVARAMADAGTLREGGALLDEEGHMVGSMAIVEFADRADLDRWLETDPYVTGGVWQDIQVRPYRRAPLWG